MTPDPETPAAARGTGPQGPDGAEPIVVDGVSKLYRLYARPAERLLGTVFPSRRPPTQEIWALRDVSFRVGRGRCLGVIGNNGAGKSTLLKILTGALHATSGRVAVEGRLFSLLDLNGGFLPELTGLENLRHAARILALPTGYVEERRAEIEAFAELGEFFVRPFRTYSAGMQLRLAFSLFAFLEPDVLLLDEALAVGDIFFQQKSYSRIRSLLASGVTAILVSHDMSAIQNLCDEVALLEGGRLVFRGCPEDAVSRYYASLGRTLARSGRRTAALGLPGPKGDDTDLDVETIRAGALTASLRAAADTGVLRLVGARVVDAEGRETLSVPIGGELRFQLLVQALEPVPDPSAGVQLYDRLGNLVFAAGSRQARVPLPAVAAGEQLAVEISVRLELGPGEYTFVLGCGEPAGEENPNLGVRHFISQGLGPVVVREDPDPLRTFYGIARLPYAVRGGRVKPAPSGTPAPPGTAGVMLQSDFGTRKGREL